MNENSNVVRLRHPDEIDDPLTNILRSGARQLLAQAIELEAEVFLASMKDLRLADGRDRVVRHGHGPERTIQTGIGAVEVARVKIRDRGAIGDGERIRFTSAILPLWARRTKSLDALLPVLPVLGVTVYVKIGNHDRHDLSGGAERRSQNLIFPSVARDQPLFVVARNPLNRIHCPGKQ